MKRIIRSFLIVFAIHFLFSETYAQLNQLHGTKEELRMGLHSSNLFRITFFNEGSFGSISLRTYKMIRGEWPSGSNHFYLTKSDLFVGAEVITNGQPLHIISESLTLLPAGGSHDGAPPAYDYKTFLPLPGFANPDGDRIAMAKGSVEWLNSWPAYWPDKMNDPSDPGWRNDAVDNNPDKAAWNGYFGKNVFNADEESYFVADDYMNREFMHSFLPDSLNPDRGGLGIRMYVRTFQWSRTVFENALIAHYDFEKIGTYNHDKMIFSIHTSNLMGNTTYDFDAGDDLAGFDKTKNLVYTYDSDDLGGGGWWGPVGYFGSAFLETPGNVNDGIDNDNDAEDFAGPVITNDLWKPKALTLYNPVIFINYDNYERTKTTLASRLQMDGKGPQDTLEINYHGKLFKFWVGKTLNEDGDNMFDDNLNGVIDENRGLPDKAGIIQYLYLGYKYIDYMTGEGLNNPMMEEKRDDGIDNDGDWDVLTDDVGADGLGSGNPNYTGPDQGEGDGMPTAGEPNFDETDVDETDMLGLTSCNTYDWADIPQYDDQLYWNQMIPGLFSLYTSPGNFELLFGSGYFGLKPGESQRFSTAFLCATNLEKLLETTDFISEVYKNNYRLPKVPHAPMVSAVINEDDVTLTWDDISEHTPDPVLGDDFEGYRIYKYINPDSLNAEPAAQFDLINEYAGYSTIQYNDEYFWLGNNSGIQHSWKDSNLVYGKDYYYLVTSYDHGSTNEMIAPAESNKDFYYVSEYGDQHLGKNAVHIMAVDPAVENYTSNVEHIAGWAEGSINCDIVDSWLVKRNNTYRVTFEDDKDYGWTTKNFSLKNITSGELLIDRQPLINNINSSFLVDGFRLNLRNIDNPFLQIDSANSGWSRDGILDFKFVPFTGFVDSPEVLIGDFEIRFSEMGVDTSEEFSRRPSQSGRPVILSSYPVNFTIINKSTNEKVPFALRTYTGKINDVGASNMGYFSFKLRGRRTDEIILLKRRSVEPYDFIGSWQMSYDIQPGATDTLGAGPGDVLKITLGPKPFLSSDIYEFTMPDIPVSVNDENNALPKEFALSQNYPNPFNPTTHFNFSVPKTSFISLKIFDILGREVSVLLSDEKPAGNYNLEFNAANFASGVYFCKMQAYASKGGNINFSDTKKILLIK